MALLLHARGVLAVVVPTGEVVPIGTVVSALDPIDVAWTGSRFAVVSVESEAVPPATVLLRYLAPLSDSASEPVEITKTGAVPEVAAFPDGSLVVVWSDYTDWYVRFVDADGVPVGDAVPLGFSQAGDASIAAGSQDEWVFVFQRYVEETQTNEVAAMRFHGATKATEEPILVGSRPSNPTVAMLPDNRFLAAWKETIWNEGCEDCGFECCFDWHQTFVFGRGVDAEGLPYGQTHFLGDFHSDEAGLNGLAIARNGSAGFAGAWIDSFESDYPAPAYVVLRALDGNGIGAGSSKVLAGLDHDPQGTGLAITSGQAVVATAQPQIDVDDEFLQDDIDLYSTGFGDSPVEKLTVATPDRIYEWLPLLAASDDGAALLVWQTNNDQSPTTQLVAQPFFVASDIACGDASYDGHVSAFDALAVLKAAVGSRFCAPPVCDATNDGATTASDASIVLRTAVGIDAGADCPPTGVEVPAPIEDPWW